MKTRNDVDIGKLGAWRVLGRKITLSRRGLTLCRWWYLSAVNLSALARLGEGGVLHSDKTSVCLGRNDDLQGELSRGPAAESGGRGDGGREVLSISGQELPHSDISI